MDLATYLQQHSGQNIHLLGPFFKKGREQLSEPVVYVDSGANFRSDVRGFAVGDGDSTSAKLDQLLNPEKDYSDLAFVLNHLSDQFSQIQMSGFLGGRRDHEIMNLAEAHSFLKKAKSKKTIFFDKEIIAYSAGQWTPSINGIFSLFAFEACNVTLERNCKYKIKKNKVFKPLSSHGLSNLGHGEIILSCDGPVFIFRE